MDKYEEITELLRSQNVDYREQGDELTLHCLLNDCDSDSKGKEAHFSINKHSGLFHCFKCGEKGNLLKLKRHFGIDPDRRKPVRRLPDSLDKQAAMYHGTMPNDIRDYLREKRLLSDATIDHYQLGYTQMYGKNWITIPIADRAGSVLTMKLRIDPALEDKSPNKYISTGETRIFNAQTLSDKPAALTICEGEFDCMLLHQNGIRAISSTGGCETFKDEWIEQLDFVREFYVLMDNDDPGRKAANKLIKRLATVHPNTSIMKITLPPEVGEKGDVTDYFAKNLGNAEDLYEKYGEWVAGIKPIEISQFKEITLEDVANILSLEIKEDHDNKIITFLCMLSAYTDSDQINVSFNSQSSSGKSYTAIHVASLFPASDKIERGNASPTAFLYGEGTHDKENNRKVVSLERKILLFYEQPNPLLQAKLRPILSHDEREITYAMTNKDKKGANRAEEIVIKGFAATIICSAGLRLDEQETTRAILLSSEVTEEKIRAALIHQVSRSADKEAFDYRLARNPERIALQDRILAIRQEHVTDIKVSNPKKILSMFCERFPKLKARNMRDIEHLMQLIKVTALLNVWHRKQKDGTIMANQSDVDQVFEIWGRLIESQFWGVSPAVMNIYKTYIVPAYNKKLKESSPDEQMLMQEGLLGVTNKEVIDFSHTIDGYPLNEEQFRKQVLMQLRASGVISHEKFKGDFKNIDKRSPHIIPRYFPTEKKIEKSQSNVGTSGRTVDISMW